MQAPSDTRATPSLLLLLLALAGLLTAGCGGGSNGGGSKARATASATTHTTAADPSARFVAGADRLCAQVDAPINKVKAKNASAREIERVVPQHAAVELAAVRALSKLTPPPALAGPWRQILAYRRTLAAELSELVKAATRNDKAAVRALAASKLTAHKRLLQTAARAGFKSCGKVG